jgi:mono/diheme cytochrome c family protein
MRGEEIMKTFSVISAILVVLAFGLPSPGVAQPAGNAEAGKKLFGRYGCYECHGWEGQGGMAGPRIAPNPLPFTAFVRYVRAPKGVMPAYTEKLLKSEQDLADIHAYLRSRLPAVPLTSLPPN